MLAIILKKSPYSEANEIITMYTRELGKVRAVARAVKSAKSKMAYALQPLFLSDLEILNSKMPSIIGVKQVETFKNIQEDLNRIYAAMFATELILKSTADEQPNEPLFGLYLDFLKHLNRPDHKEYHCALAFGAKAMSLIGYAIENESRQTPKPLLEFARQAESRDFDQIDSEKLNDQQIKKEINAFISYVLERKLNTSSLI